MFILDRENETALVGEQVDLTPKSRKNVTDLVHEMNEEEMLGEESEVKNLTIKKQEEIRNQSIFSEYNPYSPVLTVILCIKLVSAIGLLACFIAFAVPYFSNYKNYIENIQAILPNKYPQVLQLGANDWLGTLEFAISISPNHGMIFVGLPEVFGTLFGTPSILVYMTLVFALLVIANGAATIGLGVWGASMRVGISGLLGLIGGALVFCGLMFTFYLVIGGAVVGLVSLGFSLYLLVKRIKIKYKVVETNETLVSEMNANDMIASLSYTSVKGA